LGLIFLGGFATIVAGAVGGEIIWLLFLVEEQGSALYHLEVAAEEFLEMVGASIILYATIEIAAALCSQRTARESRARA
jgi:hypothetical protein